MDDGADFSFDGARSFKITSARDWNIFDHWSDDWPDKEHYVSQHAVTQDKCEALGKLLASGANERDLETFFKHNHEVLSLVAFLFSTGPHAAWLYHITQIRTANGADGGMIPEFLSGGGRG